MPHTSERTDVSEWVIHFVRDRDPDNDIPEEVYAGKIEEEEERLPPDESAFGVLLHILDVGGIRPWYSFRGGKTTIYGGKPAVCLTEMPVYNYAKYTQERSNPKRLSAYGVCVRKHELYEAGGRPVIYGLSDDVLLIENSKMRRVIAPEVLPIAEQYRYVTYDPTRSHYPIDWTHEREWRWIDKETEGNRHNVPLPNGLDYAEWKPALPLFRGHRGEHGPHGYFTEVGVLVWTHEEADRVIRELGRYADAGSNMYGEIFDQQVTARSFVVVLSEVVKAVEEGNYRAQRIEELPEIAVRRIERVEPSEADFERVDRAIANARAAARTAAIEMLGGEGNIDRPFFGYCGSAWVVTYEESAAAIRAMIERGYARSMGGRYYQIDVLGDVPPKQSLDYDEKAARTAAESLSEDLGLKFYVNSYPD